MARRELFSKLIVKSLQTSCVQDAVLRGQVEINKVWTKVTCNKVTNGVMLNAQYTKKSRKRLIHTIDETSNSCDENARNALISRFDEDLVKSKFFEKKKFF